MDLPKQQPFLWYIAQDFEQSALVKAFQKEESKYIETVHRIRCKWLPRDVNIIY